MAELSEYKTIYMSPELRQASDQTLKGDRETSIPEVRPRSSHRLNHMQSYDRGLRRSFGSTDLLHNAHPNAPMSLASDSADSLEGAVPLHADSSGEHRRVDGKGQSDTEVGLKSREDSKVSLEEMELHAGEGKGSDRKGKAKTEMGEEEEEEEEEERRLDAPDLGGSTAAGSRARGKDLVECDGEEEEEAVVSLPAIGQSGKKDTDLVTSAATISENAKYLQQHFHSLPRNVVPSEITHCLYMLEEECRGVEKESERVKCKMEFIHSSMQCVQDTLRTLLIRLVEAQSSDSKTKGNASNPAPPPPLPIHHHHPSHTRAADTLGHHHHHQCKAPHPVQSKTCLMDALSPGHCCQDSLLPSDMPSCAQRAKERAATFSAITDLRVDVERLRAAHLEERQEQREVLRIIQGFKQQVDDLIAAHGGSCGGQEEGSSNGQLSTQLLELKQEVQDVALVTHKAMSLMEKLGMQLENMQVEGNSKQTHERQN
ncbi:uncharacterized protein LOC134437472 [Engraulis encrasicolus]|uniref:uncharacterized protein LOC134437472 n=1 Tax=Engraulis encrasicolus TaxID=184585 RepID=UPI002FD77360